MRIAEIDGVPVGGSDVAPLSRYIPVDRYELAPASRVDLLVEVPVGGRIVLHADRHCEGYEGARQVSEDLVDIRGVAPVPASADSVATQPLTPAASAQTPAGRLLAYARAHPALIHRRAIAFTQYVFPARTKSKYKFVFYITDTTNPNFHEHSYDPQYRMGDNFPIHPDIIVKQGTVEEWYLINATTDRHSFHIHQMSFVAERGAGGFPTSLDVVNVPSGSVRPNPSDPNRPLVHPTITKVLLDFRHIAKGTFLFHCHMLYHEDHGMMGIVRVE